VKIGLSYSRCVKDIVDGKVDIGEVLVIIARTDFDPHDDEQWAAIWKGYGGGSAEQNPWLTLHSLVGGSHPEWAGYEDEGIFREVSIDLYDFGKLHQPRKFGARVSRRPEIWLETILPSEELDSNPAVKKAWENFQVVAGLSNVTLDKDYK
jgi:hypothetical protein